MYVDRDCSSKFRSKHCVYYEIYLHSLYNVFSFNMVPKIRVKGGVPVFEIGAAPTWVLSPSIIMAYFLKMKINKQIAVWFYPQDSSVNFVNNLTLIFKDRKVTLMLVYHCHKPVFTPKMAIFRRAGIREGGLPLPLAFQYLILLIWRPYDLNLVMIS